MPEDPVRVMGKVPVVAVLVAARVNGLVPVMLLGPSVTPVGSPAAVSAMVPVKPFRAVTVRVSDPVAPCVIATVLGEADRLKSGVAAAAGVMTKLLE